MQETYEFHVLKEDQAWGVPIKLAVFDNHDEAMRFVESRQKDYDSKLYIVQRLARFSYR